MLQRSPPPQGSGRPGNGAGMLRGIGDGLNPFTMSQMPIDSSQRNSGTVARPDQLDVCVLPRTADIGTTESARLPDQDGDSSAQARASDTRATRSVRPG